MPPHRRPERSVRLPRVPTLEIGVVLKPSGEPLFGVHGRSRRKGETLAGDRLTPVWKRLGGLGIDPRRPSVAVWSLDACLSPYQNVGVRGRLIAIVIVLAVLAFAEIRYDAQAPTAQRQSNAASGQLADPPVPEPDPPATITAAVSTSAAVQTVLVIESRRQLSPALSVFTVSRHLQVVAHGTAKPRSFPLLI